MQECFKEKKNPTLIEQKKKSHRNEKGDEVRIPTRQIKKGKETEKRRKNRSHPI
jgi:hypothetical protein